MQIITIAGNVGKDARLGEFNGEDVLNFSVAVSNGKDKDGNWRPSTWYDCALWGKRASALSQYIRKGDKITVNGRVSEVRVYEGKGSIKINVGELTLQGQAAADGQTRSDDGQRDSGGYDQRQAGDLDSEIPF